MLNPLLELLRHSAAPAQSCSQEQRRSLRLPKLRSMRPLPQSLLASKTIKTNRLLEFRVFQQLKLRQRETNLHQVPSLLRR
jgi:hypothetical protein